MSTNVELFNETVCLLQTLGHKVYVGLNQCPIFLRKYIESWNKKNDISGFDPIPALCHKPSDAAKHCYIYLEKGMEFLIWHEAWHSLQFCHDPNKDQFWLQDNQCPVLLEEMLQQGVKDFNESTSGWYSLESMAKEVPAMAVENHPEFVVSVLKTVLDLITKHKAKQQGLFDLIINKRSFRDVRFTCISGEQHLDDWLIYKNGSSNKPITLVEFYRQNGFIIPKHLL